MVKSKAKRLKRLIVVLVSWFLIHVSVITIDGLIDRPQASEYAVVFGNTVNPDGTLSNRLRARLDKALELYRDSLVKILFVSGGLGKEGHYEGSEMARYLVSMGVPSNRIEVDNQGNTTWLTAQNFEEHVPTGTSVILVTQFYHVSRSKLAFSKTGYQNISAVHADYFEIRDIYSVLREFFGFYDYLLFH